MNRGGRRCTAGIRDCAGREEFKYAPNVFSQPLGVGFVRGLRSAFRAVVACRCPLASPVCGGGGCASPHPRSPWCSARRPRGAFRPLQIDSPESRGELSGLGGRKEVGGNRAFRVFTQGGGSESDRHCAGRGVHLTRAF